MKNANIVLPKKVKKVRQRKTFKQSVKSFLYYFPVVLVFLGLLINAISLFYPVLWGIMVSFKDVIDYTVSPNSLPDVWHFENYSEIFNSLRIQVLSSDGLRTVYFEEMLLYTVLWAVFSPLPAAIFTVLMAYVIAKYQNKFTKFLYNLGILLMCLVIVGTFPAQMQIYSSLNMRNNMFLLILLSPQGCFSGFGFLLYYNLFKGVPNDYADAARIDGAGHWAILLHIYVPFIFNTAFVFYILSLIGAWNDYNTFLIWLPNTPNLSYGMYEFQRDSITYGASWPEILAGFFIVALPSAVLYFTLDKQLTSKLKVSGIKG